MTNPLGLGSSAAKMIKLGFDPLESMVYAIKKMDEEIENQEKIREGKLTRLNKAGESIRYTPHFHMDLIEKRGMLAEKLMRYGYARVPEVNTPPPAVIPAMNIGLSDGQSATFSIHPKTDA